MELFLTIDLPDIFLDFESVPETTKIVYIYIQIIHLKLTKPNLT